jgi:hypothetical protein
MEVDETDHLTEEVVLHAPEPLREHIGHHPLRRDPLQHDLDICDMFMSKVWWTAICFI